MIDRTTKLRWRRRVRRRQRQIEDIGSQTEESLDKHFFRRLGRLYEVRRFLLTWLLLITVLIGALIIQTRALGDYYLKPISTPGGIFSEGIIGSYTNANPIFASTDTDSTVSKLIFSGLLTYDKNNRLIGDLAENWKIDKTGKIYDINLRRDVHWHDGEIFSSEDVVFTFNTIQDPDTRSPYFSSWQGIKVEATGEFSVRISLPNVLASFAYSLTTGILPRHILKDVAPADLRGALFNTIEPIGTGPFKWGDVEVYGETAENREQRIALKAYSNYHRGEPKLNEFIVRAYLEEPTLQKSFELGELNAVAGVQTSPINSDNVKELNISLTGAVMAFFNTTNSRLKDAKVRKALTQATNQLEILRSLNRPAQAVDGPFLPEHIGYKRKEVQYGFNLKSANKLLDESGWTRDKVTGLRAKDGKNLILNLNTLSSAEYATVANTLQKQWRLAGVDLQVSSLSQRDLQGIIDQRAYDVLVYGIVMGSDPDQFAYWHSSQADVRSQRRLNFSNYKSPTTDAALVAGRTRIDPKLRAAKYLPFLQTWRKDAPAVALYRPRYLYTVYGNLYNFELTDINSPVDRLSNVHEWMIRTILSAE